VRARCLRCLAACRRTSVFAERRDFLHGTLARSSIRSRCTGVARSSSTKSSRRRRRGSRRPRKRISPVSGARARRADGVSVALAASSNLRHVSTTSWRETRGSEDDRGWHWIAIGLVSILLLTPGCLGRNPVEATTPHFSPGMVAVPHVSYDPSIADQIARGASYSAWIDLEDEETLDLAVWPSRLAATRALRQYRAGGPKTYPDRGVLGTGFPYHVRKVERLKNVTLAWYRLPTPKDENEVRHALRFRTVHTVRGDYKALWVIPGTRIDPDATAATGPALYSASLSSAGIPGKCVACPGAVGGPLTVAIWPSVSAARRYIDYVGTDVESRRIRNVTIDNAASFGSANISHADERAIRRALH
jgi:hypothetical protein